MDYSLLVALCPPDDPSPPEKAGHHRVFSAKESRGLWGETRDCKLCLGLVDMLVTYGWKKKVAHLLKALTIGWVDEIDTMPPDIYAERFCNYLAKKIRPSASLLQVTAVPSNLFKTPCGALGRSGGTASFFATELLQQEPAQTSRSHRAIHRISRLRHTIRRVVRGAFLFIFFLGKAELVSFLFLSLY